MLHCVVEHFDERAVQPAHLLRRQRVGLAVVADTRLKQHLVDVHVTHAGDEVRVEHHLLHRLGALTNQLGELHPGHRLIERVEPHRGQLGQCGVELGCADDERLGILAQLGQAQRRTLGERDGDCGGLVVAALAEGARLADADHKDPLVVEADE